MNGNALRNGAPDPGRGCRLIATQARPPRRQPASAGLSPTTGHRLTVRLRLTKKGAALPAPGPASPPSKPSPPKSPGCALTQPGPIIRLLQPLRAGVLENYARVSSMIFFTVSWISVSFSSPGIHCWVITGTGISNLASCMACSTCLGPSGAQP
ncbi:unknown [Collinsella sp. CAG:398]|nr:unknown [Collinsella sp. CAG:398]